MFLGLIGQGARYWIRVRVRVRGLAKPAGAVGVIDAIGAIVLGPPEIPVGAIDALGAVVAVVPGVPQKFL